MNQRAKSFGQIEVLLCGEEFVKELQPLNHTNRKARCRVYNGIGELLPNESRWFAPDEGQLNQTGYHSILQHHTILSGTWLVGQGFLLMRDYDSSKEEEHVLQLMSWPAQSVDFNPIEMVWVEPGLKVSAKQSKNAGHLWRRL